jgi:hypothetical protein
MSRFSRNNLNRAITNFLVTLDFNSFEFVYPNASTANPADIAALNSVGNYQPITSISFPTNTDQAVEINYIGFQG